MAATAATLKFPLGTDNRSREHSLPEGTARQIINLDVTRDGGLLCRNGGRQVNSAACHSLFAHTSVNYVVLG